MAMRAAMMNVSSPIYSQQGTISTHKTVSRRLTEAAETLE
jgi:hypothetical protein